jgi:hypothetical protein
MLLFQVISYTEVTCLEDQDREGSESGCIADEASSSHNSAGVQLLDKTVQKHDMMAVDDIVHGKPLAVNVNSCSAGKRSQHLFSKLDSAESTPLVKKGSSIDEADISTGSNCDVSLSGHVSGRTNEEQLNYERTNGCAQDGAESDFESQNRSCNIPLESQVKSRNSTVKSNLPCNVVTEDNTLTDHLLNINASCQTSDMSQAEFSVPHNTDTGNNLPEGTYKAGVNVKDRVDSPEKMDGIAHNDSDKPEREKKVLTGHKFQSYDEADKKCGLILCNFPTVSNLMCIVTNNNNNNNNSNCNIIEYDLGRSWIQIREFPCKQH